MTMKKYTVLVTKSNGDIVQLYRNKSNRLTLNRSKAVGFKFSEDRKREIQKWAKRKGFKSVEFTSSPHPFVVYDTVTTDGDEKTGRVRGPLEKKLNNVGRRLKRKLFVGEGKRSSHAQWKFYMAYLNGQDNLAARCCTKYAPRVKHSWASCGKNSQSNHYTGDAADTVVMPSWTNIGWYNGAVSAMKAEGLGLPVGGEAWHVEISNSFNGL
jgi:hypothetical protein